MKNIIDLIITSVLLIFSKIAQQLSIFGRAKFGIFVGNCLKLISNKRKEITFENVKNAFPNKNLKELNDIVDKAYQNLGITLIELLSFPSLSNQDIRNYLKFDNIEILEESYKQNKGVLLMSGHFGNWELLSLSIRAYIDIPVNVIVKKQSNSFADVFLNKYRKLTGNNIIDMSQAARQIVDAIRNHETVAMLVDQNADEDKDIFIDFFGRKVPTFDAPAKLVLKYNTPVIIGFTIRQPDFTYKIKLQNIKIDDLDKFDNPIEEFTKRHVKILEEAIKENPHLWSWQHNRWKLAQK